MERKVVYGVRLHVEHGFQGEGVTKVLQDLGQVQFDQLRAGTEVPLTVVLRSMGGQRWTSQYHINKWLFSRVMNGQFKYFNFKNGRQYALLILMRDSGIELMSAKLKFG